MTASTAAPAVLPTRTERLRADATDRLEAALLGAGPHLEAVLDVGSTERGDLLLVLPAPAAGLPDLLAVPGWPTAGEAVTVLVPLAQALARLHRAGVALGAAGPESVVLDPDGAPLWRVPPAPVLRRAGSAAFGAAVEQDRERFAGFAAALLARTGRLLPEETDPDLLADALFDVAEPCAVRLAPVAVVEASVVPARLVAPQQEEGDRRAPEGPVHLLRDLVQRARRAAAPLRAVRRRVWAAAACAVAAPVLAVALLPGGHADAVVEAPRSSSAASASVRPPAAPGLPAGPVAPKELQGRAALPRLLAARMRCAGTERCIAAVDAAGSPVDVADRRAADAGVDPVATGGGRPRVLSEGGGTVVADVGGTVVVAVRQTDGWRLRDVVAEPPG